MENFGNLGNEVAVVKKKKKQQNFLVISWITSGWLTRNFGVEIWFQNKYE